MATPYASIATDGACDDCGTAGKCNFSCKKCVSQYNREYRSRNKEQLRKRAAEQYLANRDSKLERQKDYYKRNKSKCIAYVKEYYAANKEEKRKYFESYYASNRDQILENIKTYSKSQQGKKNRHDWLAKNKDKKNAYQREYFAMLRLDPIFNLRKSISNSIRTAIKKGGKNKRGLSILNYLPYSIDTLKTHLEEKFEPWMNWDNYGPARLNRQTWQIDHIIPQSKLPYDSMEHPNFQKCWALDNLRPLEAIENMRKGNKMIGDNYAC